MSGGDEAPIPPNPPSFNLAIEMLVISGFVSVVEESSGF